MTQDSATPNASHQQASVANLSPQANQQVSLTVEPGGYTTLEAVVQHMEQSLHHKEQQVYI